MSRDRRDRERSTHGTMINEYSIENWFSLMRTSLSNDQQTTTKQRQNTDFAKKSFYVSHEITSTLTKEERLQGNLDSRDHRDRETSR